MLINKFNRRSSIKMLLSLGAACSFPLNFLSKVITDPCAVCKAAWERMFHPYLAGGWDFEWDVIHFNVGLHDLKYMAGKKLDKVNGTQVSSLELYEENLTL